MESQELLAGAVWLFTHSVHADSRGTFTETYLSDQVRNVTGQRFEVAQINESVSAKGVIRGIHYTLMAPGQAKYVRCTRGRILDFIVDLRISSPTFGTWTRVELSADSSNALYLSAGLGHAFEAMDDFSTVNYLCSTRFNGSNEYAINPLDADINIPWQSTSGTLSDRDRSAPSLAQAMKSGLLPRR